MSRPPASALFRIAAALPLLLFLLVSVRAADAEADKESEKATEARLLEAVKFLADDALEGRGVGTKGLDKAAEYLAEQFSGIGLRTELIDGRPFQPFKINMPSKLGPAKNNSVVLRGPAQGDKPGPRIRLKLGNQFNPLAIGGKGQASGGLVFAGYGITAKDLKYDDYAGLDVKDKVVVIIRKEPQQNDDKSPFDGRRASRHAPFMRKVSNAYEHGAAAVLMVNDAPELAKGLGQVERQWKGVVEQIWKLHTEFAEVKSPTAAAVADHRKKVVALAERLQALDAQARNGGDRVLTFNEAGSSNRGGSLPVFFCDRGAIDKVVQAAWSKSLDDLEKEIDSDLKPRSGELTGWTAECRADMTVSRAEAKNVIAVLDGEGPLADETVVVGAHYDHVGMGGRGSGSLAPWTVDVHNGADDNASGTSTILEVARRLVGQSGKPRRRIVFIAFSGEERGLLGSAHYTANPIFSLEKTVAMINLDMVGRLANNKLIISGTGTAKSFEGLLDELNKKYEFALTRQKGGFGPSDHSSFYAKKIPVMHIFTGTHNDYHRPSDDYDKVNLAGMRRICDLTTDIVERLANAESRPEYVAIKRSERPPRGGARPYLGSIPDFGREVKGYALMGVTPKSPADQAGMKAGDVIVKFGDSRIGGLEDIDSALRKFKPGDKVPVVVQRGEKKVTLTVVLGETR